MMKSRRRHGLIAACAFALAGGGCASILGDFESTPGGGAGDDGGTDTGASNADGTSPVDASSGDDGSTQDAVVDATDAGDAADSAIPTLNCIEQGGSGNRVKLATVNKSGSSDKSSVKLFSVGTPGQTRYRAIVEESPSSGPSIFHVFTFGNGGGNGVTDTPVPGSSGGGNGVIAIARYAGGIAALVSTSVPLDGGGQKGVLEILTLADTASSWTTAVTIPDGIIPSCTNRLSAALHPIDATANDFLAELSYQTCGNPPGPYQHAILRTSSGTPSMSWPLPPMAMQGDAGTVDAGALGFDFAGVTVANQTIFSITNPNGNNGPNPGIGSATFSASVTLGTQPTTRELPLADPADLMQTLSITSLASGGAIGLGILEANLSSQTVTPTIYTGHVLPAKMATLVPSVDLQPTTLASIADLPINGATYHWETFGGSSASDNFLAVGSVFPGANGLNFIWWNGSGGVRSKRTGTTSFFYFDPSTNPNGLAIYGGDVTFSSTPFAAIAGFQMVFVQADPEASTEADVWATQIACSP